MLGPQPHLANNAVLAHRPGKPSLDNAFTLIEGHQALTNSRVGVNMMLRSFYLSALGVLAGVALGTAQDSQTHSPARTPEQNNPAAMVMKGNPSTIDDDAIAYWEEKLRGSSQYDQEAIQETIKLLRSRPRQTERVQMSQAAED